MELSKIDSWYKRNTKPFLYFVLAISTLLLIVQSYYASPRTYIEVLNDTKVVWLFTIPMLIIFSFPKPKLYLSIGIAYLAFSLIIAYLNFLLLPKPFATIFFTTGLWLVFDFLNQKFHVKNCIKGILKSFRFFVTVIFVGIVLATVIEILNAQAMLWWYYEPFPSIKIFDVPITFIIGWVPWILALISGIYLIEQKFRKK